MFSRKRAQSNPPVRTPPSSAASTAAAQAFLANRASNANLSSAAATAALRSYTASPTPVGEIQTKRMIQRRGSASSNGSAAAAGTYRPGGLQRKNSSGSMSERSFRDPSPSRANPPLIHLDDAPPVPALPRGYVSPPTVPVKSIRRPASVEPPERISSPTPRTGGRGVSLDRGPGMISQRQNLGGKPKPTPLKSVGETDRVQNRDSVNFSRPMSPQISSPNSPVGGRRQNPHLGGSVSATSPSYASRAPGLRDSEANRIQHSLQEVANRPVKKKKKLVARETAQGSHFPSGRNEDDHRGTASITTPQRQSPSNTSTPSPLDSKIRLKEGEDSSRLAPRRRKKKNASSSEDRPGSLYTSDSDTQSERSSFSSDRPRSYNTRIGGLLAKQPSVVREDREAEEKEEQRTPLRRTSDQPAPTEGATVTTGKAASKSFGNSKQHNRSVSQPTTSSLPQNASSLGVPARESQVSDSSVASSDEFSRHLSLSPARAAHFANQLVLETPDVLKHQPPARSVSPAKSALKPSPSSRGPSPLGVVPGAWNQRNGRAASEASDTTSVVSDDGLRNANRKKKEVKVKFDEEPVLVGRASSPPTSPDSPMILSPQNKSRNERVWPATSQNSGQEKSTLLPSFGSAIKPTPDLPSFGSVRTRDNQKGHQDTPVNANQVNAGNALTTLSSSTDQIISRIFAQDAAGKGLNATATEPGNLSGHGIHNDPLPPEVTSVEGTGYPSDEEDSDHGDNPHVVPVTSQQALPSNANDSIPVIAILPATPAIETQDEDEYNWLSMPGGFPLSTGLLHQEQATGSSSVDHHEMDATPASIGIAEPEPEEAAIPHEAGTPAIGHVAEELQAQTISHTDDEAEHTDGSIYSDAAEDFSDFEGDGFGSINAIVESPAKITPAIAKSSVGVKTPSRYTNSPGSSLEQARPNPPARKESELSEPALEEGWERAQAYWSGLSETRKKQLEQAAASGVLDASLIETKSKPKKKKAAQKRASQSSISEHPPLPPWPDKQYRDDIRRPASPKTSAMRQSMRNSQPEPSQDVHLRSSMRNGVTSKSPRNSLNISSPLENRGTGQRKSRPVSAVAMVDYNKDAGRLVQKHNRAASASTVPSSLTPVPVSPTKKSSRTEPKLRQTKSNDSDSSSSFKRARPSKPESGQYTMRRSMRSGPSSEVLQSGPGKRASSYSARSTSPTESARRPFSSVGPSMRTSMRGSTNFGNQSRTKSPSRFGFGRTSKSKLGTSAKSGYASRFGDSSDEEGVPAVRRSRFVDSSDDEDMTPVRGIPRRIDEGDSTDLEDSSAEHSPIRSDTKSRPTFRKSTKLTGSTIAAESARSPSNSISTPTPVNPSGQAKSIEDKEKKKRSLFGGLGGKKRDDSRSRKLVINSSVSNEPLTARPKTPGAAPPATGETSPIAASPKSPKLQRRNTPKRVTSDTWPLPDLLPPPKIGENRPNTSDGNGIGAQSPGGSNNNNGVQRPDLGNRRSTVQSDAGVNGLVLGKSGKKKRFPILRKAFRLHD